MKHPVRVIVVAPHPLMLAGLRSALEQAPGFEIVAACSTFLGTLQAVRRLVPAVVVADGSIGDGWSDAYQRLRHASPKSRLAVIASPLQVAHANTLAGAVDIILPPEIATESLVDCVMSLGNGASCTPPLRANGRVGGSPPSPLAVLTFREREIAQGVARGKRNKEIAEAFGITPGTVKLHLHRIYAKLGVNGRLALYKKLAEEAQPRTER